ncbi:MAG TPA: heme ABC exporter ATP-binding protein CcmA [Xanthomonadales bacterium]|nr:heme ABC exporter ATP-binding protein CcmA [Xanthomonadales bacterium]
MDTDQPPLIEARGLALARDDEPIFGPLSFRLDAGRALVIEGSNGAGKTTLIRVLAGLVDATEGDVLWSGAAASSIARTPGSLALLGHHFGLKGDLTPHENLRFRIALEGLRPGITPVAALKSVGLEGYEDVAVRSLSAGQRKRVALAALLLTTAPVWLLDEPYANLDRDGQILVDRMLETHCLRGGCVVLTSHGLIHPALSRMTTMQLHRPRSAA